MEITLNRAIVAHQQSKLKEAERHCIIIDFKTKF
jgi:hypothetical protein